MHPVLFRIPGVNWPLHTYGVLIVSGFLLAVYVAWRDAHRHGRFPGGNPAPPGEVLLDFSFWALLCGMIGARVVFIAVNWEDYARDPVKILKFWEGGLVFYGAALGGVLAWFVYARQRGIGIVDSLFLVDILITGLPLAAAFGRLGCVAAGCCWGDAAYHIDAAGQVVADAPLTIQFPQGSLAYSSLIQTESPEVVSRMREIKATMPLLPVQLMDSFFEVLLFAVLTLVRSRKLFHGQVLLTWGFLYPILRSSLEMLRGDAERGYVVDGLSTSQFISILVASASLIALVVLGRRHWRKGQDAVPV